LNSVKKSFLIDYLMLNLFLILLFDVVFVFVFGKMH